MNVNTLKSYLENSVFQVKNLLDFFFFFSPREVWDDTDYSRGVF